MRSIKEIFVIGHGPSSSHTMGPAFACEYILNKYKDIKFIKVILYGSLASTGKGHLTDYIIDLKLKDIPHNVEFNYSAKTKHPNTLDFIVDCNNKKCKERIVSIGGGSIVTSSYNKDKVQTYPLKHLTDIVKYCKKEKISLYDYVIKYENSDILEYLEKIYDAIEISRSNGIAHTGVLPGKLHVKRKAREMYLNMREQKNGIKNVSMNMAISSFAVAEENASGGVVVIAPTCGSAGVIPGCITFLKMQNYSRKDIVEGLAVAGLIGMIAKTNASVSGAECGCQAEIGVACAMAASMVAFVTKLDIDKIASAAEIAMEHSLGLTCDPVDGYVQIPCIERCAVFASKAITAVTLASIIPSSSSKVSFDQSLKTMYETGRDLKEGYRETAKKGLAKTIKS